MNINGNYLLGSENTNDEYIKVIVTSNVGADTCYDFVRYDYKVNIKSQIIKTSAFTDGFKEFVMEVIEDKVYLIVGNKRYEFKKFLCFSSIDNCIYDPDYKHNHNIGYLNYETLVLERKKVKSKKIDI